MKHYIRIVSYLFFFNILFFSCAKKELPAPHLAESGPSSLTEKPKPIEAPCDSILILNQITSSTSFDGYKTFSVYGRLNDHFDYIEIFLSHYSTSSRFEAKLPVLRNFAGKKKYQLDDVATPYRDIATLTHRVGAYYGYMTYYTAEEGDLYVDYGNGQVTVSFCNVKVKTETSFHYLTGKIRVDNKRN